MLKWQKSAPKLGWKFSLDPETFSTGNISWEISGGSAGPGSGKIPGAVFAEESISKRTLCPDIFQKSFQDFSREGPEIFQ